MKHYNTSKRARPGNLPPRIEDLIITSRAKKARESKKSIRKYYENIRDLQLVMAFQRKRLAVMYFELYGKTDEQMENILIGLIITIHHKVEAGEAEYKEFL